MTTLEEFISIFDHLMGAADQVKVMLLVEVSDDSLAEGEAHTAVIVSISVDAALGV